jgi:hypothetical protein
MTLLAEIQAAALDSAVPLADLLRKCKVLAAGLKHQEFADWVNNELSGYAKNVKVPSYREVWTPVSIGHFAGPFGSGANNVPIPVLGLPDFIRDTLQTYLIREPARQLEQLAAGDTKGMQLQWASDIVNYVATKHPMVSGMTLMDAFRPLSPGVLAGVVDNIRSRILDFALAIRAEDPAAGEAALNAPPPISPATTTHIYNQTIVHGQAIIGNSGKASIGSGNVATSTTAGNDITQPSQLLPLLSKLREEATNAAEADVREEAVDVVNKMERHASAAKFDPDRMLKYLSLYGTLVTTATNTLPQIEHAVKALGQLIGVT